MHTGKLMIDECQNCFGPLREDIKGRLQAVLENPTPDTWDAAASIIISLSPMRTLWQAWVAIDPTAPRTGRRYDDQNRVIKDWQRIPDTFTLYRAIKTCMQQASQKDYEV